MEDQDIIPSERLTALITQRAITNVAERLRKEKEIPVTEMGNILVAAGLGFLEHEMTLEALAAWLAQLADGIDAAGAAAETETKQ